MEPERKNVTVVYLCWVPLGTEIFKNFIQSYLNHPAGFNHELFIIFNGLEHHPDLLPFEKVASEAGLIYQAKHQQNGLDLDSYHNLSRELQSPFLLFLNSYTTFLTDNWLAKLMKGMEEPATGIVAPSGSYQSLYSSVFLNNSWQWERQKSARENISKYKLLFKTLIYWRFIFPPFPNPHFRTSSFLIRRELFLTLKVPQLKNKLSAYRMESGYTSLSRQVMNKSYQIKIVSKDGIVLKMDEWRSANIFWQKNQGDLIISDKQSLRFDKADDDEKRKLTLLAWGESR